MGILRAVIVGCIGLAGLSAAANYGAGAWLRTQPGIEAVQTTGWPLHLGAELRGISLPGVTLTGAQVQAPLWDPLAMKGQVLLPAMLNGHLLDGVLAGPQALADISLGYSADLPVTALRLTLRQPQLTLTQAPDLPLSAGQADTALTRQPTGDYTFSAQIADLGLPAGTAARLLPGADLEDRIESVTAQAQLSFLVPPSVGGAQPALDGLRLDQLAIAWGGRALKASGTLTTTPEGLAQGTLNLTTADWQAWLAVARGAGLLGRADRMVEMVLRGLASGSTDNTVTIPVTFTAGRMSIGPLPTDVVMRLR